MIYSCHRRSPFSRRHTTTVATNTIVTIATAITTVTAIATTVTTAIFPTAPLLLQPLRTRPAARLVHSYARLTS
jgi:hypothetical protein